MKFARLDYADDVALEHEDIAQESFAAAFQLEGL